MEDEKKKKTVKIVCYSLFALAIAIVIVLCIVSAVYKNKKNDLDKKNEQFKDYLSSQVAQDTFADAEIFDCENGDNVKMILSSSKNFYIFN